MAKIQNIERLFYYIVTYSYLVFPLYFLFSKNRKGLPLLLCIYGVIVFSYLSLFNYLQEERAYSSMLLLQNLFTPFEYLIFTGTFFLSANKTKKRWLIGLSAAFISFLLILFIFYPIRLDSHLILDTIPVSIETILIFIYIFFFLYEHSKTDNSDVIYNNYLFWVSVGLLLYMGGTFFFNILVTQMSLAEFDNYWHFTYIAEILKNILFLVALLKISPAKKKDFLPQARMPYLDIDMN